MNDTSPESQFSTMLDGLEKLGFLNSPKIIEILDWNAVGDFFSPLVREEIRLVELHPMNKS